MSKHGKNAMHTGAFDLLKGEFEQGGKYMVHDCHDKTLSAVGGSKPDLVVSRGRYPPTEASLIALIELKLNLEHKVREYEQSSLEVAYEALPRCPTRPFILTVMSDLKMVRL